MNWLDLVKSIAPTIITATVPGGALLAPLVIGAITEAEQIHGATGDQKLQYAVEITRDSIRGVNAVAGHTIVNPLLSDSALAAGISAAVDVVNIVHQAQTPDIPSNPVT